MRWVTDSTEDGAGYLRREGRSGGVSIYYQGRSWEVEMKVGKMSSFDIFLLRSSPGGPGREVFDGQRRVLALETPGCLV